MQIIKDELLEVRDKYNDKRRTEIDFTGGGDFLMEDLIEDEQVVVTITHQALIKRTSLTEYRQQGRGGKGMKGSGMRDEDYIEHLFVSFNHDYLLFFTDHGKCYWLRVFEMPEGSRTSKGRSIRNLIEIAPDDRVRSVLAITKSDFEDQTFLENHYVIMATRQGLVKKTPLSAFSRPRVDGIIAIEIMDDDELLEAHLTGGNAQVILACSSGRSIRFDESDVRPMGRATRGVRGMSIADSEHIVGMVVLENDDRSVLVVSEKGFGKRSLLAEYRTQSRGGKGIITMKRTPRTGSLVAIKGVEDGDDLMIVTHHGIMIRMSVSGISTMGRNTQGVRLINLRSTAMR
jgi:DNA gyrase subunit A